MARFSGPVFPKIGDDLTLGVLERSRTPFFRYMRRPHSPNAP